MIGYGISAVLYKLAFKHIDSLSLTLVSSLLMAVTSLIIWLTSTEIYITRIGIEYAIAAGIISGIAFVAFITSTHQGEVGVVATLRGLSFLIPAIVAMIFLSEKLTMMKAIGIMLAVMAIVFLSKN